MGHTLLTAGLSIYVENLMESMKTLLEVISKFRHFSGYNIKIQNSIAYPYSGNEQLEAEIKWHYHS